MGNSKTVTLTHNVLVRPVGSTATVEDAVRGRPETLVMGLFSHVPGKDISIGQFLDAVAAQRHMANGS